MWRRTRVDPDARAIHLRRLPLRRSQNARGYFIYEFPHALRTESENSHLPSEEELTAELKRERESLDAQMSIEEDVQKPFRQ